MSSSCPKCARTVEGVFPAACPHCDFNISPLVGRGTTDFQRIKWQQHSDILQGREVQLYGKEFNASFDFRGYAVLDEIVRFTLTYGDRAELPAGRGRYRSPVIVSYIPEPIGAGTALYSVGGITCSGICLVSPQSADWAHSFPVIGPWVDQTFRGQNSFAAYAARPPNSHNRYATHVTMRGVVIGGRCCDPGPRVFGIS
jgi:hypothetical protein